MTTTAYSIEHWCYFASSLSYHFNSMDNLSGYGC